MFIELRKHFALTTAKGKKGGKLGECEAALKRQTDRPIIEIKTSKNMAIGYSNER